MSLALRWLGFSLLAVSFAGVIVPSTHANENGSILGLPSIRRADESEPVRNKSGTVDPSKVLEQQKRQLAEQSLRIERLERALRAVSHGQLEPPDSPAVSKRLVDSSKIADWPVRGDGPDFTTSSDGFSVLDAKSTAKYPTFRFGGQYRLMYNAANFDFHDATIGNKQPSQSFFNQRFRPSLTVQTSDRVEGYIQMEIGHILWGENFELPHTYVGPRFPPADDRVGIELRYGYLTYMADSGRWRAGIQGWQDSFGQTLASSDWDFNVGGVSWLTTLPGLGEMRLLAGAFVLFEGDIRQTDDAILWTLDGDWQDEGGDSLGWSLYVVSDHGGYSYPTASAYDSSWDVWLGVRGTMQSALVPLHAFAVYNYGRRNELGGVADFVHSGFACKVQAGPQAVWFGKLRFQLLYSTGEADPNSRRSGEFRTVAQSVRDNFGAQGYWSYLVITSPHVPSDVNDLGVSLQNRGLGLFTAQTAFECQLAPALKTLFAAGWLNSDEPNPISGSRNMGTELVSMFTYDFGGGLIWDFGAAVLFTGDFYRRGRGGPAPATLWEAFSRLQLEF